MGVWQFMKVNRRLQAAEEGIERIMAILNEYFSEGSGSMKDVKNEVNGLADDVNNLKNMLQVCDCKFLLVYITFRIQYYKNKYSTLKYYLASFNHFALLNKTL